ncbi:MAG: MFS transporter [Candidatus Lokiarchaeota archaeon]|nr:MFS transporter [Candidatus Lokiarchaeota archaeon]
MRTRRLLIQNQIFPYLGLRLGLDEFQIGLISSSFSFCQLFASPITGKLSDRYGRKPMLIISQISTLTGFLLLGVADAVYILILARVVDGLLGSNMTVSQAVISDLTDHENRTHAYSYSTGVFGAGLIIGPAIGGAMVQINFALPMFFAAGLSLLSIILVLFLLPETNPNADDELSLKFNDVIPIKDAKRFLKTKPTNQLIIMFFFYIFGFMLCVNNLTLYAINKYDIAVEMASYYRVWIGILRVILQGFFVNRFIRKKGEPIILKTGIIALIATLIGLIFIDDFLWVLLPLAFLSYGSGVARPILTSQITKSVTDKEYATVLGVSNSLNSIAQIISPSLGGALIQYSSYEFVPLLSASLFIVVLILSLLYNDTSVTQKKKNQ